MRHWGSLAVLLAVWELAVVSQLVDAQFLPPVHAVGAALWDLGGHLEMWEGLARSTMRALVGLLLGTVAGTGIGILMASSAAANGFFGPLVAMTYSLPKAALVPLFILWLGIGDSTNILTVFLASLLPVIVNTYHGVRAVPTVLVWSARALGTPRHRILRDILLPGALPYVFTGIRVALGFSWVLTISAEMIAAKSGIGKLIFVYGESGAYAYMFAGIAAILVIAFSADRALLALMRRMLHWDESAASQLARGL
jgi:ABC-type nitrate/sulfonate/bicarbonate transport system permease component